MASIHKEIVINAPAEKVWDAVRDVGAVHRRLAPGLVTDVQMEGEEARLVTFANGRVVRELIVDIDDKARRLAYAPVGGLARHHHSSIQIQPEGTGRCRLIWITDVLPGDVVKLIMPLIEQGSVIMKRTLEA